MWWSDICLGSEDPANNIKYVDDLAIIVLVWRVCSGIHLENCALLSEPTTR
jgi:hypothetical protein